MTETTMAKSKKRGRILIVDDEPMVRKALSRLVARFGHWAETVPDGERALSELERGFDLVLLDAILPGIKGFEVVRRMRADERWRTLPVIMLTAHADRRRRLQAIEAGVNDFLSKPVDVVSLRARSESLLRMKAAQDEVKAHEAHLEVLVRKRTAELEAALEQVSRTRDELREASYDTIRTLAAAAEYRDELTGAHVERVGRFCAMIARRMGMSPQRAERIEKAAQLHDVGKIGVPDGILLKKGRLTPEERQTIERHAIIGAKILAGAKSEVLKLAKMVALSHHERWDGRGYPRRIAGDAIPVEGRICAVADVFDALTSERPYKPAFGNDKAYAILEESRGSQFDPAIVEVFLSMKKEIGEVQRALGKRARPEDTAEPGSDEATEPVSEASGGGDEQRASLMP